MVLISGGGTGIGKGIALAFAESGAKVALCGRRAEPLQQTAQEIQTLGGEALTIVADICKPADCRRAVAETVTKFGALHILINNAGTARYSSLAQTEDADIEMMIDTNMKGTMLLTKYAIPELVKQATAGTSGEAKDGTDASILMIASSVADKPLKDFSVYSAAKAGLVHFTRCLALELGSARVRVNCINPGVVETPIFGTMMPGAAVPGAMKMYSSLTPLGRIGQPVDIARMAIFLSGPQSEWITGAVVTVDGGISLA